MKLKPIFTLFFIIALSYHSYSQCPTEQQYIYGNEVKAALGVGGAIFSNAEESTKAFVVPYIAGEPETSILFSSSLWIGGQDPSGNLKLAAETYSNFNEDYDFASGPINDTNFLPFENPCDYNRYWEVRRHEIMQLIADFEDNNSIDDPIADNIKSWPARGNPYFEDMMGFVLPDQDLAPFFDRNENGLYEPDNGEYPIIGPNEPTVIPEHLTWKVINDIGVVHGTGGSPIGVEVHEMKFAFNCSPSSYLNQTVFTRHKIINKSQEIIYNFKAGISADQDIGCYTDDYIGYTPVHSTVFGYNIDPVDGANGCDCYQGVNTYCDAPPVASITLLNRDFDKFIVFNNPAVGSTPLATHFPETPLEYYRYLSGLWRDGSNITTGGMGYNPDGLVYSDYCFPGSPFEMSEWSMLSEGSPELDRSFVASIEEDQLGSGEIFEMDVAWGYYNEDVPDYLLNIKEMWFHVANLRYEYLTEDFNLCTQEVCVTDCVWPGDIDNDGIANHLDVLSLGVAIGYNAEGAERPSLSFSWSPKNADVWSNSFEIGTNFKYSDCNGNGETSIADLAVIEENYNLEHSDGNIPTLTVDIESNVCLSMVHNKDTVSVNDPEVQRRVKTEIHLGTESDPMDDIYGIAFTVEYDTTQLELSNIPIFFNSESGFIEDNNDVIKINYHNENKGELDISVCRIDGQNISGFGEIARFYLQVKEDAPTANQNGMLELNYSFKNVRAINFEEQIIGLNEKVNPVIVTEATYDPSVSTDDNQLDQIDVLVYPNPSNGVFTIEWSSNNFADGQLLLYNKLGELVKSLSISSNESSLSVNLDNQISSGIYFLKVISRNKEVLVNQKIMIHD